MDERTSKDDESRPTPGSADERCLEAVRPFCAGRRVDESGLRRAREVCSNVETTTRVWPIREVARTGKGTRNCTVWQSENVPQGLKSARAELSELSKGLKFLRIQLGISIATKLYNVLCFQLM